MADDNNQILQAVLSARASLYRYLSRAFSSEPDEALLRMAATPELASLASVFDQDGDCSGLQERAERFARGVLKSDDPQSGLDALRASFTRLFVGPGSLPSSPWESASRGSERLLFTEDTLNVRRAYRAAGFKAAGYPHEPDDHVSTELAFMARMSERVADAVAGSDAEAFRAGLASQAGFLEEHLNVWLPGFARGLEGVADAEGFYGPLARLAALLCQRDAGLIRELLCLDLGAPAADAESGVPDPTDGPAE